MARLEAQAKMLYYPTPNFIAELAATWFKVTGPVRIADPCCGTGEALRRFANGFGMQHPVETWGVELSQPRAQEAASVLDCVLPTSFYLLSAAKWSAGSVGLMFNNPPYDYSDYIERDEKGRERRVRHELLFTEGATRKIIAGGHQVIIIPRSILGDEHLLGVGMRERFARHVLGWYETVMVFRFPDGDYERFKQVIVLALNKRPVYLHPGKESIESICALADEQTEIPVFSRGAEAYVIPATPAKARFTYTPLEPAALAEAARQASPVGSQEFTRATYVRPLGAPFTPAMPLSVGHVTMLITGQETGVLTVNDDEGRPMLVKGMSRKLVTQVAHENQDEKGRVKSVSITERERYEASLALANSTGNLELLASMDEVSRFMTGHAERLAEAILEKNRPLYNYDPTPEEWRITSRSALGLPPLPGRTERGLFQTQRHFAIAATRVMKKYGNCLMNCELGMGKTSMSISSLEIMNKWPALIMAPGHMLWKWQRDLERVSDPESPITARVITRPALSEMGRWPGIRFRIESLGGEITSTKRKQLYPLCTDDPGQRRLVEINASPKAAGEIAALCQKTLTFKGKEKDDQGKVIDTFVIEPVIRFSLEGLWVEYVDKDEYTLFDFVADYKSGLLGKKAVAVVSFDTAKYDAGLSEKPAVQFHRRRVFNEVTEEWEYQRLACCPTCGHGYHPAVLQRGHPADIPHFCDHETTDKILQDGEIVERKRICGTPLFEMSRWRRIGLAPLVKRKFRHFFKVYVADEIHTAANGSTDIGTADQRLLSSTRYSLALTGTLFGGVSGSLFYLLYRRLPELRRLYAFDEKTRWIDHYGLWEKQWDQEPHPHTGASLGDYGASTGIRRRNYRQKELPGISPSVIRYLLPITLFGSITDLGYSLPPVNERVEPLEMPDDLRKQVKFIEHNVLKHILSDIREFGDAGGLSAWFSACRFRPASAWRPEVLQYIGQKGGYRYELPAVTIDWLPKERRLAEIVRENMSRGRKTLVFVEQSGTRDIRPRLKRAIEECAPAGLLDAGGFQPLRTPNVGILSADDMAPAKREAWIVHNAPSLDVLIVNPKLVQTGLDLVMFSTLVFFETTVSLPVLWQSMRRVWRLGQSLSVDVIFLAYMDTVEETILQRMGQKKKAAQLLYGKSATGVLVETDDGDLQREIIQAALEGKVLSAQGVRLTGIFTDGSERQVFITTAPTGSMVAASPNLAVLIVETPKQMTLFGELVEVKGEKKKRK
jgi:hypothetical protein